MLTWNELLKISVTMCRGLAFLHDEIEIAEKGHKPAVAHRDFKSKNVLLRPDLTACIADFGLAHVFYPSVPVGTCHGQVNYSLAYSYLNRSKLVEIERLNAKPIREFPFSIFPRVFCAIQDPFRRE
jgi:serine/threonine protein kinase